MKYFKVGSVVWEVCITNGNGSQYFAAKAKYKTTDTQASNVFGRNRDTEAEAWEDAERFMAAMGGEEVPA